VEGGSIGGGMDVDGSALAAVVASSKARIDSNGRM